MEKMYDVEFELLEDGSVRMEQESSRPKENCVIWLHPEQLKLITRCAFGMESATAESTKDLERKLAVITDRLARLVTADWFRQGIINECKEGIEMIAKLDALVDLAVEMDGGRLLPDDSPKPDHKQPTNSHDDK